MKCKKCGYELQNGVDVCPRCSTSQSGADQKVDGTSMQLPKQPAKPTTPSKKTEPKKTTANKIATPKPVKKVKTTEEANEAPKKDIKDTVKSVTMKAQQGLKETVEKVAKASTKAANNLEGAVEDIKNDENKRKVWLYVAIAVAVVVLLGIIYGILNMNGSNEETNSLLLAVVEDEVFLVDGEELIELDIDAPESISAREIFTAIDANSFYVIDDAEMDEEYGIYTGDLIFINSNGKEKDIDDDVVMGSLQIVGKILWYLKADDENSILCCYDGKNIKEVVDDENLDEWYGTDKFGQAYYTTIEYKNDEYEREVFFASKGDSDSIMDDVYLIAVSNDYKKLLMATDDEDSTLIIYDGKDDFDIIDDAYDVQIDPNTFNMLVLAEMDDEILYYVPYGKDPIELDDEVQAIATMPSLYSSYVAEIGNMAYYLKNDDLYVADLKGEDTDKIFKDIEDLEIKLITSDSTTELVYVDDDEIIRFNFSTFEEIELELPEANDLMGSDAVNYGDWYVYKTEDNEELYAYNGRRDAIELSNDADEIDYFSFIYDGKYVIWLTYDEELIVSQMKENTDEEIADDVFNYWVLNDGTIYYLKDYEYEDSTGDLYVISKIGKEEQNIEDDVTSLFALFYE